MSSSGAPAEERSRGRRTRSISTPRAPTESGPAGQRLPRPPVRAAGGQLRGQPAAAVQRTHAGPERAGAGSAGESAGLLRGHAAVSVHSVHGRLGCAQLDAVRELRLRIAVAVLDLADRSRVLADGGCVDLVYVQPAARRRTAVPRQAGHRPAPGTARADPLGATLPGAAGLGVARARRAARSARPRSRWARAANRTRWKAPSNLTHSYNGAAYGRSIPIEAAAGPFDLGKVTRVALSVD